MYMVGHQEVAMESRNPFSRHTPLTRQVDLIIIIGEETRLTTIASLVYMQKDTGSNKALPSWHGRFYQTKNALSGLSTIGPSGRHAGGRHQLPPCQPLPRPGGRLRRRDPGEHSVSADCGDVSDGWIY